MKTPILAILALCGITIGCTSLGNGKYYTNADNEDTHVKWYPNGQLKSYDNGSNRHSPIIHGYDKLISHAVTAGGAAFMAGATGGSAPVAEKAAGAAALLGHAAVTNSAPPATPAPVPAALQAH